MTKERDMRIVVIGASGQLGSDLMRALADDAPVGVDHALVDIEAPSAVAKMLAHHAPELVINTAAYHNVDLCEMRPDRAMAVNALAVDGLAAQCALAGAALAHISTDYVFDGATDRPYVETDAPNPISAYGISKYAGERLIARHTDRTYFIRTSGLYGIRGSSTKGYTFIERMLSLARAGKPIRVVGDVTSSPSYTRHVAAAIASIVRHGTFGTYHVASAGACTWYEFAREIFAQAGLEPDLTETTATAFASPVRRPAYSALASSRLPALGLPSPPPWRRGIADYLAERAATDARARSSPKA